MAKKALLTEYIVDESSGGIDFNFIFYEDSTGIPEAGVFNIKPNFGTITQLNIDVKTAVLAEAVSRSYTGFTENDIIPFVMPTFMAGPPSQATAARSLNSAFQISTTRNSFAIYNVDIATFLSLSSGQSGTVILEIADNSGFTAGVQELSRSTGSNTGSLSAGVWLGDTNGGAVIGFVPAGKYVRIRTVNNTGTPTFTYRSGQEVLM